MTALLESFPSSSETIREYLINFQNALLSGSISDSCLEGLIALLCKHGVDLRSLVGAFYVWTLKSTRALPVLLRTVGIRSSSFLKRLGRYERLNNIALENLAGPDNLSSLFESFTASSMYALVKNGKSILNESLVRFRSLRESWIAPQGDLPSIEALLGFKWGLIDLASFIELASPRLSLWEALRAFKKLLLFCFPPLDEMTVVETDSRFNLMFLFAISRYWTRTVLLPRFSLPPDFFPKFSNHFRDLITLTGNIQLYAYLLSMGAQFDDKFGRRLDKCVGTGSVERRLKFREIRTLYRWTRSNDSSHEEIEFD